MVILTYPKVEKRLCKFISYCVKSAIIRSFSSPYFAAFGQNTEIYSLNLRIQSKCGKIRTRKTPNTDTFHAVMLSLTCL